MSPVPFDKEGLEKLLDLPNEDDTTLNADELSAIITLDPLLKIVPFSVKNLDNQGSIIESHSRAALIQVKLSLLCHYYN
jgi:hypothetical protein